MLGGGIVHVPGLLTPRDYLALAEQLGRVVQEERIALRPGAHAYVAKPGSVPLHTDHPDVDIIGWYCEEQDTVDGASLLLDAQPVVDALSAAELEALRGVEVACPPLAGGPPTEARPVLRRREGRDEVFCSPWLHPVLRTSANDAAVDGFRARVSAHARDAVREVHLRRGDALFIDNHRVLHGRRAIAEGSRRCLHRVWIRE